jgi:hypothetical protein
MNHLPPAPRGQGGFLALLPAITTHARIRFRHLPAERREEAVANTIAHAFAGYHSLARRRRLGRAYASTLAEYAVRATRSGRVLGSSQSCRDALSPVAQRRHRFAVLNLGGPETTVWRRVAGAGHCVDPSAVAVFNLDFEMWLGSLGRRLRRLVTLLVAGWRTGEAARKLRVSAGRVSQLRWSLEQSWRRFQGIDLGRAVAA